MHGEPGIDGTRNGDGHATKRRSAAGDSGFDLGFARGTISKAHTHGRAARAINAIELLRFRVPDQREEVAANAVASWLQQAQGCVGGNRCVYRRPALLECVDSNLGGDGVGGGRGSIHPIGWAAGGKGWPRTPVAWTDNSRVLSGLGLGALKGRECKAASQSARANFLPKMS